MRTDELTRDRTPIDEELWLITQYPQFGDTKNPQVGVEHGAHVRAEAKSQQMRDVVLYRGIEVPE